MEELGMGDFWKIIMGKRSGPCRESVAPSGGLGRNWGPHYPLGHCSQCSGSVHGVFVPNRRPVIGKRKEEWVPSAMPFTFLDTHISGPLILFSLTLDVGLLLSQDSVQTLILIPAPDPVHWVPDFISSSLLCLIFLILISPILTPQTLSPTPKFSLLYTLFFSATAFFPIPLFMLHASIFFLHSFHHHNPSITILHTMPLFLDLLVPPVLIHNILSYPSMLLQKHKLHL